MTHKQILSQEAYDACTNHIMLKRDSTTSAGDTFIASLKGFRVDKEFTITDVLTDKVNAHFCILLLKAVMPAAQVNDLADVDFNGVGKLNDASESITLINIK